MASYSTSEPIYLSTFSTVRLTLTTTTIDNSKLILSTKRRDNNQNNCLFFGWIIYSPLDKIDCNENFESFECRRNVLNELWFCSAAVIRCLIHTALQMSVLQVRAICMLLYCRWLDSCHFKWLTCAMPFIGKRTLSVSKNIICITQISGGGWAPNQKSSFSKYTYILVLRCVQWDAAIYKNKIKFNHF